VATKKAIIAQNVQEYLDKSDWKAAIREMERLFAIDRNPLIRVRIGDTRRKLNRQREAIRDYIRAADLFAEQGFMVKALAQYSLALRLDSSNSYARSKREKIEALLIGDTAERNQLGPREYRPPRPFESVIPQYV